MLYGCGSWLSRRWGFSSPASCPSPAQSHIRTSPQELLVTEAHAYSEGAGGWACSRRPLPPLIGSHLARGSRGLLKGTGLLELTLSVLGYTNKYEGPNKAGNLPTSSCGQGGFSTATALAHAARKAGCAEYLLFLRELSPIRGPPWLPLTRR